MKENVLVIALILNVICVVVSLKRIKTFEKEHMLEKTKKTVLIYISILFPFVGLILTRNMRS
jgi:hypothetical protein